MRVEQFFQVVAEKKKSLSKERDEAFNSGDFTIIQNCANQLRGISFVMNNLKFLELKSK